MCYALPPLAFREKIGGDGERPISKKQNSIVLVIVVNSCKNWILNEFTPVRRALLRTVTIRSGAVLIQLVDVRTSFLVTVASIVVQSAVRVRNHVVTERTVIAKLTLAG